MSNLIRLTEILLVTVLVSDEISVSHQLRIEAQAGDSVQLPCVYGRSIPDTASVHWRDNNNSVVLDIKQKKPNFSTQAEKYKKRVSSSESGYSEGNFSITLTDVKLTDSSSYECHITKVEHLQKHVLKVTERRSGSADISSTGPGGSAVVTSASFLMTLLPPVLSMSLSSGR